jgi:TorA maturation chaperone TorD
MHAATRAMPVDTLLSEEDAARVRWYRFLARVFQAAPDESLLASVAASAAPGSPDPQAPPLALAWVDLAEAARRSSAAAVREEYDRLFVSVGKAPVLLNASYHLSGFLNERPLADLREHLATLGLARRTDVGETEDHLASLCEVMALLIESDDPRLGAVSTQQAFFRRFVSSWYERLAESVAGCDEAQFYRPVARLMQGFFDVERQAFDIEA